MMNHSKTNYTLNMDKAWKKKLGACKAEYKVRTEFKGGNYVFEFSAAMYELYRTALVEHLKLLRMILVPTLRYYIKIVQTNQGHLSSFWLKFKNNQVID